MQQYNYFSVLVSLYAVVPFLYHYYVYIIMAASQCLVSCCQYCLLLLVLLPCLMPVNIVCFSLCFCLVGSALTCLFYHFAVLTLRVTPPQTSDGTGKSVFLPPFLYFWFDLGTELPRLKSGTGQVYSKPDAC
ncbi:hypothetical protein NE237_008106 [Protea cynaroides]|uniref:Uncharacterized protein n=1 Tax=Protea cynaroides TaxID=273540 RepID=A0A9Q0KQF1_9MAGN|nr:hypothetical protein NE237_008106 [Protea cynaroides]